MKKGILCAIVLLTTTSHSLDFGGYGQNHTSFVFADTGYFADIASLRLEGSAGNELYELETHILLTGAYQPLNPEEGLKKGSKMLTLFEDLEAGFLVPIMEDSLLSALLAGNTGNTEGDSGELSGLPFMANDNSLRYLTYTSFYPKETFTIDRLLIKLYFKRLDVYLGRQQIAWGTGYAFNPTDIWNLKNPLDVSAPKYGINALRIEIPLGELSNLNIIGVPGADIKHSSAGMRLKTHWMRYDLSASFIRQMNADRELLGLPERLIAGADFAGQVKDIGVWGEAAFVNFKFNDMPDYEIDSNYVQVTAGADYTLDNGLHLMVEYYFNGLGNTHHSRYNPFDIFLQYLGDMAGLGKNYIMTGLRKNFWDKIDAGVYVLANLDDASAVIMPEAEYYWSDEVSLNLGATLGAGEKETTEFGSMVHGVSLKATAYF